MKLLVEHVRKEYVAADGPLIILRDVSLSLTPGETLAVTGPSGSGKSTLLNIIGSLDMPTAGGIELDGVDVTALTGDALAGFRARMVGFIFQEHHLLPQCTALENVMLPTLATDASDGAERAGALLDRVGLAERMASFPAQLSGGERQRVAIARALINGPPLLLCDEPTGNLDNDSGARVGDLFMELARERQVMLIVVTHDVEFASRFGRSVELRDGMLVKRRGDG